MLDQLSALVTADQVDVRLAIERAGGRWVKGFWAANACLVEIPTSRLPEVVASSRVLRIQPNQARGPASIAVGSGPIWASSQSHMHNHAAAHNPVLIPAAHPSLVKGAGITIGFLDTGLDLDDGNAQPSLAFMGSGGTRLLGSFLVPGSMPNPCAPPGNPQLPAIDCNSPGVHPFYYLYQQSPPAISSWIHPDARHGTGMASVALGHQVVQESTPFLGDGHAPDAFAIGWSISRGHALANQGCPRWVTDAVAYLDAIQMIVDMICDGTVSLQILTASYDGFPDPADAVNEAFDELADGLDVLLVTAAGNTYDSTGAAHGLHNGLAVGAVWKNGGQQNPPGQIFGFSARGPIESDIQRFFPDVCAIGHGDLEHLDRFVTNLPQPPGFPAYQFVRGGTFPTTVAYSAFGTSVAAPHVAGAAAHYMSRRSASPPAVTALETRAAILVNVLDEPCLQPQAPPLALDTYQNRNAYGVGFVRDDFLAEYAERFGSVSGSHLARNGPTLAHSQEMVTLSPPPGISVQSRMWTLADATEYVVAIAWNRPYGTTLSNVDLEIWTTGGQLLAQSNSAGNSYERAAFKSTQAGQTVEIRVIGKHLTSASLPVQIAARRHPALGLPNVARRMASTGTVVEIPQPPCLTATNPNQVVDRVVPVGYAHPDGRPRAYGSAPFAPNPSTVVGIPKGSVHYIYGADTMGGAQFTANSVSLRLWRGIDNTLPGLNARNITLNLLGLAHTNSTQPSIPAPGGLSFDQTYPPGVGVKVVQGRSIDIVHPADVLHHPATPPGGVPWFTPQAQHYDSWPIRIPFDQLFTYDPLNGNLAFWWDATFASGAPAQFLRVDSLADIDPANPTNCWMTEGFQGAQPIHGMCPVLGFSTHTVGGSGGPAVLQRPRLHVMGEPAVGEWLWFWTSGFGGPRLGGPPPGGAQVLLMSTQMPAPQLGCQQLFSWGDLWTPGSPIWIPLSLDPDGRTSQFGFLLPDVQSVLYSNIFAQVLHVDGATVQASSGLHLRVGGRLQ